MNRISYDCTREESGARVHGLGFEAVRVLIHGELHRGAKERSTREWTQRYRDDGSRGRSSATVRLHVTQKRQLLQGGACAHGPPTRLLHRGMQVGKLQLVQ